LLALLVGIVTAGLLQSSAASIAIIQVFAMNHMANWESAVFIVLGQAIGMCITTLIVSSGTQKFAKRVSVIHLLLNVVSVVLVGLAMLFLFFVMRGLGESKISSVDISLFYTIYNIASIFLLAPFASYFVQVSGIIIKDSEAEVIEAEAEDKEEVITLRHLDERILESPSFALENAVLEVVHMGDLAVANTKLAFEAAKENNLDKIHQVYKNEKTINNLEKLIIEYLVKISNLSLTEKQHTMINNLFYSVSDLERVGDHAENIAELAEFKCNNNIIFTESAQNEIAEIMDIGLKSIEYAVLARREGNVEHIRKVMKYEDMVDNMEEELREKHIERLSLRQCEADSGIVFLDIISNLERISDHANNIVGYVNDEME
jgi:phosphate:Na+ symporter